VTAVTSPEALADPIGVIVGLVTGREPSLDRTVIAKVTEDVAGGRSKRRRLAQALLDNPEVLADGRSPAPRAVADLLISLRRGRRGEHLAAGLRGVRQAPAQLPAPRRGLVLQCLRPGPGTVLGLRLHPARQQPRPGREAPLRPVPSRRR
jgi:hypothetical protein